VSATGDAARKPIVYRPAHAKLPSTEPQGAQPQATRWIVAPIVALAAFMEVLDISIANVSLQHIAGSLGASQDEATWVLTSYLVTNAIVLPITGWLSAVFGRKRFYLACILGFGISSFFCGLAPSLGLLILFRAIQGLTGGGLQPAAQAILADTFTPAQRGMAFAFYGIAVVFAPAIGPTLGGWITDNYSWQWIFLINVPISIGLYYLIDAMIEDPPQLVEERATLKE
jgi:MFS transporter, DHA2 family, multidrug resistance protein